jgi:hypothetical protein
MDAEQILANFEFFEQEIEALKQMKTGLKQEVSEKLRASFFKATGTLDETASDFNFRLNTAIENTKTDIDIKVESLKSELDLVRDSMFSDLDSQEEQLRK